MFFDIFSAVEGKVRRTFPLQGGSPERHPMAAGTKVGQGR